VSLRPEVHHGELPRARCLCLRQWLCAPDDRIVDHLAVTARPSPAAMAAGPLAAATRESIDERCRILARVGFLVVTDGGVYERTTMGLRSLDGEVALALLGSGSTDRDGPPPSRQ